MPTRDGDIFRTFCHISEYGDTGYANLHRMIAASSPLVLWAPSSALIASPACRLGPTEFVKLVENQTIRVIGREDWIMNRAFRDGHRWPGAQWLAEIDEPLKSMAIDDQRLPRGERRVVLAAKERGDTWAVEHLERNPDLVESLYSVISAPDAVDHFPPGVIETALSSAETPRGVVQHVVRAAYNHDAAIGQAGTRTPFLLAPREARFHQLLESVRAASDIEFTATTGSDSLDPTAFAELTAEVIRVLQHLEGAKATKISAFVRSEGHELLADWMRRACESVNQSGPRSIRGELIRRLRAEFDGGKLKDDWRDIFMTHGPVVGLVGTGIGVADSMANELSVYGALGLATGAYAIGQGLAQKLGFASVEYDGPQWAFIYAFGRRATGRRTVRLRQTLDLLTPG